MAYLQFEAIGIDYVRTESSVSFVDHNTLFIRRFLLHILPTRFTKIRHYGLLANRDKIKRLRLCKRLTGTPDNPKPKEKASYLQLLKKLTGKDFSICPCCGLGRLSRAAPA